MVIESGKSAEEENDSVGKPLEPCGFAHGDGSLQSVCPAGIPGLSNVVVGGRYLIRRLIGQGAWSVVYLGYDRILGRDVAVKMLHLPLSTDPENLRRFELEAKTASSLSHPNIATIFDYGVMPSGQPYIVLEVLTGESLAERLARQGPMPQQEAVELISQVARALSHAHNKHILHRDIKPSNIFLVSSTTGGDSASIADSATHTAHPGSGEPLEVRLLDFGLAKWLDKQGESSRRTATGVTVGTPSYMSPEQCQGLTVDARSDIYSLGCTLYEMLSGDQPFSGSAMDCMHGHVLQTPPGLCRQAKLTGREVSPALEQVVRRAMAKSPQKRPASAAQFLAALNAATDQRQFSLRNLVWQVRDLLPCWQRWLTVTFAAILSLVLAYFCGPSLLSLAGVRTVEVDAADVAPSFMDELVADLVRSGRLSSSSSSSSRGKLAAPAGAASQEELQAKTVVPSETGATPPPSEARSQAQSVPVGGGS